MGAARGTFTHRPPVDAGAAGWGAFTNRSPVDAGAAVASARPLAIAATVVAPSIRAVRRAITWGPSYAPPRVRAIAISPNPARRSTSSPWTDVQAGDVGGCYSCGVS